MVNLPRLPGSRPGQKTGQLERSQQYTNHFNAKLVSLAPNGEVVAEEVSDEVLQRDTLDRATAETEMILRALDGGADQVVSNCSDARVVGEVRKRLGPERLQRVRFSFFDTPVPKTTVRL